MKNCTLWKLTYYRANLRLFGVVATCEPRKEQRYFVSMDDDVVAELTKEEWDAYSVLMYRCLGRNLLPRIRCHIRAACQSGSRIDNEKLRRIREKANPDVSLEPQE